MASVIALDVNETLLDLSSLDEHFERAFGNSALRQPSYALRLQLSFVGSITDAARLCRRLARSTPRDRWPGHGYAVNVL